MTDSTPVPQTGMLYVAFFDTTFPFSYSYAQNI
ncbi:MAG: hypothetical protein MAG451_00094 [Anaerolineales bacterium]|nr:hypothetical protein [Anaerolineales bacterium]